MQFIRQEKFNKTIKENFNYSFEAKQDGLYLIEIIASCKSWKQNLIKFISFFKDDDLTVKINNTKFSKLNSKRGLFNSEVAWNGNNLKGFSLMKILTVVGLVISASLIWLYFLVKVNNLIDNCVCAETTVLSEMPQNSQYGEFNYSAEAHELIRAVFLQDLEEYKKDRYHYGDVFKNTIDECQKSNFDLEYIITGYYDDLVKYTHDNKQFLDAVSMFSFMHNVKIRDVDNDGENEIIFIKKDVLNNEYLIIIVIDKINNKFQIMEKKVEDMAFGRIEIIDLTGDLQPEIALLAQNYRWGERLFVYQYLDDKKIKEIFEHSELVYPIYTFSDANNNGRMEIKVDGYLYNNGHPVDEGLKDIRIYEYDIGKNNFILLN